MEVGYPYDLDASMMMMSAALVFGGQGEVTNKIFFMDSSFYKPDLINRLPKHFYAIMFVFIVIYNG